MEGGLLSAVFVGVMFVGLATVFVSFMDCKGRGGFASYLAVLLIGGIALQVVGSTGLRQSLKGERPWWLLAAAARIVFVAWITLAILSS